MPSELEHTEELNFATLLDVLERTHRESQARASQSVNHALVGRNWLFGWHIVEYEQNGADRAEYGKKTHEASFRGTDAEDRTGLLCAAAGVFQAFLPRVPGHFGRVNEIPDSVGEIGEEKSPTLSRILERAVIALGNQEFPLSWSHYVTLLTLDNKEERRFYEIEANANSWSVRELDRQINSGLYQRLALSRDKDEIRRLAEEGQIVATAADLIKNPLVLEFLNLDEKPSYTERDLETAIIDKLQVFLLELGKGFLFECRQKRFTFDAKHYYVDLVLYNRLLRCYVLVDLKLGEIVHGDLGQMQMYVNYYDREVKLNEELPTIGIVLCARKNDAMVELTLPDNANVFASKYQLYLPSKDELKEELERIEMELGG